MAKNKMATDKLNQGMLNLLKILTKYKYKYY